VAGVSIGGRGGVWCLDVVLRGDVVCVMDVGDGRRRSGTGVDGHSTGVTQSVNMSHRASDRS
jgi:hypothetical protein